MKYLIKLMFIILLMKLIYGMNLEGMRFIYQEDMSEHCKRKVIPSVFLGNHVMNADARIMHFSKLDVPYSCFIGVRTESGSHIIMVLQLQNNANLTQSCDYGDQFLVFQLSETFGGYWGLLPDSVYKHPYPQEPTYYTMSVDPPTTASTDTENDMDSTENEETNTSESVTTPEEQTVETVATMVMEVPLVNISGYVVPAVKPIRIDHHLDRHFDKYFDVTPRVDLSYATKIVPLLEVSPMETTTEPDRLRNQPSRYKLKYNADVYGFRPTLTSWRLTTRIHKLRNKFFPKILARNTIFPLFKRSTNGWPNTNFLTSLSTLNKSILRNGRRDGFQVPFEHFLKQLNDLEAETESTNKNAVDVDKEIENVSEFPIKKLDISKENNNVTSNVKQNVSKFVTNMPNQRSYVISPTNIFTTINNVTTISDNEINKNYNVLTSTSPQETLDVKKNVKQIKENNNEYLNTAASEINNRSDKLKNGHKDKQHDNNLSSRKRKRYIEAIQIENAIPWTQATTTNNLVITDYMEGNEIVKNLASLIELSADEIEGRIARGNINKYMSNAAVFNICEHKDYQHRHVILLNTSRLFLLITNFNLQGMTLVLTNAETMEKYDAGCLETQLECQVSGHRVCIDSSCACDGIPNCGSYDIYDEDKLRCYSIFITNNMHLAVIAFVVLIFTLMYAVYFWLQRCVSDVSEAFFVYITGTDNILNLNSIMKSPNDTEEVGKLLATQASYLEEMTKLNIDRQVTKVRNLCSRCFLFLLCRKARKPSEHDGPDLLPNHLYSFTQLELSKMLSKATVDAEIQTGESLEMESQDSKSDEVKDLITNNRKSIEAFKELKLLKESQSRSSLNQPNVNSQSIQLRNIINKIETMEEKEVSQVEFDELSEKAIRPMYEENTTNQEAQVSADVPVKKIRFEDHPKSSDDTGKYPDKRLRTSADYGAEKNEKRIGQSHATTSKDQRWFWSKDTNKNKKGKK